MLVALGPGGTRELAERALAHAKASIGPTIDLARESATEELGGLAEVCTELGVTKRWLGHVIAGRRPVPPVLTPEPLVTLSATPVWDLADWREWATVNGALLPLLEPSEEADPFADS